MVDWAVHRARREHVAREHGQWVGILDRNYMPVCDVEDWSSATWPSVFADTGSMEMVFPGELDNGAMNPAVSALLTAPLGNLDDPASMERLFHEAAHVVVERPGLKRRCYRVFSLTPEGGRDAPRTVTVTGLDTVEHLKHLPLWANPANRSKIVQLQFADLQRGSAEEVSRKLVGRNLIGYQQPSLLANSRSWTDTYSSPSQWSGFAPDMHAVICSPIRSGIKSEFSVLEARWDNAWDLLKATWDAAGILPVSWLWLPGDDQPFPQHTTLRLPTVIIDFKPRSTFSGAAGLLGQGWKYLERQINSDNFTSVMGFADAPIPTADGRAPWVVFEPMDAPEVHITKSMDHTFLVGGQSPKGLNDLIEVGIKTAVAAIVSMIPGIGPVAASLITGGGELLARMSADRFLNLNEFTDQRRKQWHGRSGYTSISKPGQANTFEALQKAWQAKTETAGGLSVEFAVDGADPYVPGRDFDLGDTAGLRMWGAVWAAYVSELTWTSTPDDPAGWVVKLGNLSALKDLSALLAENAETVRGVISRWSTYVSN